MSSNADYATEQGKRYMANSPLFPGVGWNGRWESPYWGGIARDYAYWAVDNDRLMAYYLEGRPHTYENALKILHNDKYSPYYTTAAGVQCAGLVNFAYLEFLRFHASEYGIDPNLYREIQDAIINYDYESINRAHPEYGLTSERINLNNTCTVGAWTDTLNKAGKMIQYHPTGEETWRDYVDYLGVGDIILFTGKSYLEAGQYRLL